MPADQAKAMEKDINELRSQFVEALGNPPQAQAVGAGTLGQLLIMQGLWLDASDRIELADQRLQGIVDPSAA